MGPKVGVHTPFSSRFVNCPHPSVPFDASGSVGLEGRLSHDQRSSGTFVLAVSMVADMYAIFILLASPDDVVGYLP
jgi:hypothetical protein